MYGIYANIGGILMVNVTIYSIHGSYGLYDRICICSKVTRPLGISFTALCIENVFLRMPKPSNDSEKHIH